MKSKAFSGRQQAAAAIEYLIITIFSVMFSVGLIAVTLKIYREKVGEMASKLGLHVDELIPFGQSDIED
jgi:hypothetical protein